MIRAANFGEMNSSLPSVITVMIMVHRVWWVMSRTRRGAVAVIHGRACLERRRATGPSRLLTHLQSTDLTTTAAGRSQAAVPAQFRREVVTVPKYPSMSYACKQSLPHARPGPHRPPRRSDGSARCGDADLRPGRIQAARVFRPARPGEHGLDRAGQMLI